MINTGIMGGEKIKWTDIIQLQLSVKKSLQKANEKAESKVTKM